MSFFESINRSMLKPKNNCPMKYIVITGGVMSGIGKGITASSIGVILKNYGSKVTAIKIDPYLNQDAGTMSPFEHGECYVLEDGGETDLDLGNYERFLNISLTKNHNITMGKIYNEVLNKERNGDYLGKTVQVVPHITDHIIHWIEKTALVPVDGKNIPDTCIIELGGTIGDIESMPFIEALRQLSYRKKNMMFIHVSYIPVLKTSNEEKTKPTQHSIQLLRSFGIQPDVLCVRCEKEITDDILEKMQNYAQVMKIIPIVDAKNIYRVPLLFDKYHLINCIQKKLNINIFDQHLLDKWKLMANNLENCIKRVSISIIGKYTGLTDSYLSLTHGIKHAAMHSGVIADINFVSSEEQDEKWKKSDAVIIPGGFGIRGIEGMLDVIKYARENNIPMLGICLGMQLQCIEIARNICGITDATSEEFDQNAHNPIIIRMDELDNKMGGTMRLGLRTTTINKESKIFDIYGQKEKIQERHRHRYEVNPKFIESLEQTGLKFVGKDTNRMEIIDYEQNKFHVGCQFHPEYQTYPDKPHPLFMALIKSINE